MSDGNGEKNGNGDDEYVCHVCGKSFPSVAALHRHVREAGIVD